VSPEVRAIADHLSEEEAASQLGKQIVG
jgi:hypothetical protein